jgi:hypothetical protein
LEGSARILQAPYDYQLGSCGGFYAPPPREPDEAMGLVEIMRLVFIGVIFLAFMISLLISVQAASEARGNILDMRHITNEEQFKSLRAEGKGERILAARIFVLEVGLLAFFTLIYAPY